MNKEELLKLKELIESEIKEIEKTETKSTIRQKPAPNEIYYYVNDLGLIDHAEWGDNVYDIFRFNSGNCFKTEQEAKDFKDNILTKQAVKDIALELNNGIEIDWNNYKLDKYYIYFKESQDLLLYDCMGCCDHLKNLNVYCLDPNFFKIVIDRIGQKKLIKLLKSDI